MCGISGFIDFSLFSNQEILEKMNRTMNHRGPDGEGYFVQQMINCSIGLAHRRLSIIDLEGSPQPMTYNHFTITFNGEIYNYEEIKNELIALGHTFVTAGDTEVILHAYAQWGTNAVNKFIGMFAFAMYDAIKEEIFICRDRAGVKPLFYYWDNSIFLFGSELKSIVANPLFSKKIDINSVASFINYGYVPTPNCIYSNTYKLKPGHFMTIKCSDKTLTISQYWNPLDYYNLPKLDIDYNEAKKITEEKIVTACNYRMVADVPVGIFLSGGYDSSLVAAILQSGSDTKLNTFTIGVGDKNLNEAPYAKDVAHYIQSNHNELYCTSQDALDIIPQLPIYYDEPYADSSAIPTILVSRMAAKSVKVAISADAGDELFAGYNRYEYYQKLKVIERIPKIGKSAFKSGIKSIQWLQLDKLIKHPLASQRIQKVYNLINDHSIQSIMGSFTEHFTSKELSTILKSNFNSQTSHFDVSINNPKDTLSAMMAMDYQTYLLDDILVKVDRATMSQSIEGREPFLDHNLLEWAAQLPNEFKYHKGNKKRILKDIAHQYLPYELMNRPKKGFAIPINQWMREILLHEYEEYFSKKYIERQEIFDYEETNRIITLFLKGNNQYGLKVWHLLSFQMWYKYWMN